MTIYVDNARILSLGGVHKSHMAADSLEELHVFAKLLGVGRYHAHREHPHYDVNETERRLVVAAGAVEVRPRELLSVAVCARRNNHD